MAAEPVGTAYVIIRALTSQLSKDIKDGLDKGSKDADTDAAGREIGRSVGESAGDEFGDTWNESSSDSIRDSADSRETKKAQKDYSDRFFTRFSDHFGAGGEQMSTRFRSAFSDSADDGDLFGGIDIDRAAGTFGSDLADEQGNDYDIGWKRNVKHTLNTTSSDDGVKQGMSGVALSMGESIGTGTAEGAAKALGKGFPDAMSNALGALSVPGGPLVSLGAQIGAVAAGPALQVIGAIAGEAVAVIGFIGTAAAGAGVAIAGIGAAVAPAFFGIKAAFSADSDELDDFNDHMKDFNEQWQIFGFSVQENLLPHLHTALDALEELIPIFAHYGETLGEVVGVQAQAFAEMLTSHGNKERIRSILDQGTGIISSLGGSLVGLVTPILQILNAAMPIAQKLADAIGRVVDKFAAWIDMKSKSGELTAMFDKWYNRFTLIMGILGDLGSVLADVFGIGADSSDGMFESLKKITEQWKEWTNSAEGQNKIAAFFESAKAIAGEVFGLIGDIIGLIVGPMTAGAGEGTSTNSIVGFFKTVREVWLPAFVDFAGKAKEALAGPVSDLFKTLTDFIKILGENPAILKGIFGVLFSNFFIVIGLIKGVIAVMNTSVGKFLIPIGLWVVFGLKVLNTLKLLKPLMKGLQFLFQPLIKSIQGVAVAMRGAAAAFLTNPITIAIVLIVAALTLLYFHFKPFRNFVDRFIIDPLQRLWTAIGGFKGILEFFKSLPALMGRFIKAMPAIGANIFNFFKNLPTSVPALFSNIKEAITGFLSDDPFGKVAEKLREFGDTLVEKLGNVPVAGAIARFLQKLLGGFANLADFFKTFDFRAAAKGFLDFIKSIFAGDLDFSQVADKVRETLGKVFGVLSDAFKDVPVLGTVFETLQGLFTDFDGTIQQIKGRIIGFLDDLIAKFGDLPFIGTALKILKTAFTDFGAALDLLGQIPVLGSIIDFFRNLDSFSPGDVLGRVTDALSDFFGMLGGFASTVGTALLDALQFIAPILGQIFTFIGNALLDAFNFIAPKIGSLLITIGNALLSALKFIGPILGDLAASLGQLLLDGLQFIGPILGRLAITIGKALFNGLKTAGQLLGDAVGFLLDKIIDILPNLGTLLGKGLGKAFKFAFSVLGKILPVIFRNLGKIFLGIIAFVFGPMLLAIGAFFLALGPAILAILVRLPSLLLAGLKAIVNFFVAFFRESGIGDALVSLGLTIAGFFMDLPGIILDLIVKFGPVVGRGLLAFGIFIGQQLLSGLANLASLLGNLLVAAFNAIPGLISGAAGVIGTIGSTVWGWIKSGFSALVDVGQWVWDWLVGAIGDLVVAAPDAILGMAKTLWGWIQEGFDVVVDVAVWIWNWLSGEIAAGISAAPDAILSMAKTLWGWFQDGFDVVMDVAKWIWDWFAGEISTAVTDGPAGILEMASILWGWFQDGFDAVIGIAGLIWNWIGGAIADGTAAAPTAILQMASTLWNWVKDGFFLVLNIAGDIWDWISGQVSEGLATAPTAFTDMAGDMWEWIVKGFDFVTSIAADVWGWITDGLGSIPGAALSTLLDIGGNLVNEIFQGIANWLRDDAPAWVRWIAEHILGFNPDDFPDQRDTFTTYYQQQMEAAMPGVNLTDAAAALMEEFQNKLDTAVRLDTTGMLDVTSFVSQFGDAGSQAGQALADSVTAALDPDSPDGINISDDEMSAIVLKFNEAMGDADFTDGVNSMVDGWASNLSEVDPKASLTPAMMGIVNDAWEQMVGREFTHGSEGVVDGFAKKVGDHDQAMVAPTNKLVDKIMLTMARLVKETPTKVINPWILIVVDGFNKVATQATAATNKLVNQVLLTMARLVNETPSRVMNPFVLIVVSGMNNAATRATAAAVSLVNQVVFALSGLTGRMTNILAPAGVRAAEGLANGFKLGLVGFLNMVRNIDDLVLGAIGNLNSVLFNSGVQLVNGLILGMASRLDELRIVAGNVRTTASNIPHLAGGGIINQPTLALIGEAGREAVIPLSRPTQALRVMRQSGLDQLVMSSAAGTSNGTSVDPFANATSASILTIEHADIFDKVDVDIIAARMKSAYKSLPGR